MQTGECLGSPKDLPVGACCMLTRLLSFSSRFRYRAKHFDLRCTLLAARVVCIHGGRAPGCEACRPALRQRMPGALSALLGFWLARLQELPVLLQAVSRLCLSVFSLQG